MRPSFLASHQSLLGRFLAAVTPAGLCLPTSAGTLLAFPAGTDLNSVQQAVLSSGTRGTFGINVNRVATTDVSCTLQGGALVPGLNPNPTPIAIPAPPRK